MKLSTFVVATAGEFTGQIGRVISSHTYQEIGLHYSVRFPSGGIWIAAGHIRPATPAEARKAGLTAPHPLRPAA